MNLPIITNNEKRKDLHAQITVWRRLKNDKDGFDYEWIDRDTEYPKLIVHMSESDEQYKAGFARLEIRTSPHEVINMEFMLDALFSVAYTAYDPTIIKKALGIFTHATIRIKSWLYAQKNNKK